MLVAVHMQANHPPTALHWLGQVMVGRKVAPCWEGQRRHGEHLAANRGTRTPIRPRITDDWEFMNPLRGMLAFQRHDQPTKPWLLCMRCMAMRLSPSDGADSTACNIAVQRPLSTGDRHGTVGISKVYFQVLPVVGVGSRRTLRHWLSITASAGNHEVGGAIEAG